MKLRRPEGTSTQQIILRSRRDKLGGRKVLAEINFNEDGTGECSRAMGRKLLEAFPVLEEVGSSKDDTTDEGE